MSQPAYLADAMLRETAFAWFRGFVEPGRKFGPTSLSEPREKLVARFRRAVKHINGTYDVAGLCRQFPARMEKLRLAGGDHIGK